MTFEISKRSCDNTIGAIYQDFLDIDQQAECLTGYDQKYQQLSSGRFVGQFRTAIVDSKLGFYFEKVNQIIHQSGAVPQDHYSIILIMNDDGGCKLNGQTFSVGNFWCACPGSTFDAITVPGNQFAVIDLDKEFFEKILIRYYPKYKYYSTKHEFDILVSNPANAHCLRQAAGKIFSILGASLHRTPHKVITKRLRMAMAEMIAETLYDSLHSLPKDGIPSRFKRYQIAKCACDYINDRRGIDVTISDLCRLTNASRRTIEYSFQDCIGQSPIAYLRSIKLNEIRRALLSPENAHLSIGDIAAQWGVWHLSRFAQYYRKQFDELPSKTRRQI